MINIERLVSAFPIDPVPARIVSESDASGEIQRAVIKSFLGRLWTDISLEDWIYTASVPALVHVFTPIAFHYYLPSLLSATLAKVEYLDWGVDALIPQNKDHVARGIWWTEYSDRFSGPQKEVVLDYLSHVSSLAPDGSALKHLCSVALPFYFRSK